MDDQLILLFQIKPSSGVPIYRQIVEQVTRLVVSGQMKAGDALPSVRQVADFFEVNPMTVSKAYSQLEGAGVLERLRGKGMIVASGQSVTDSLVKRIELIESILREAAIQANQLGIPKEAVLKALAGYLEESK